MQKFHLFMAVVATMVLTWRGFYPTESYSIIFNITNWFMKFFIEKEFSSNSASMYLIDYFNGIVIGLLIASGLSVAVAFARHALRLIFWSTPRIRSRRTTTG